MPRQPQLRPPAALHLGDDLERLEVGLLAALLAGQGRPPEQAVLQIGVDLQGLAQQIVGPLVVTALGRHLGQVGEDDARGVVLAVVATQHLLGAVEVARLHEHDAACRGGPFGVGVDLDQPLGRVQQIGGELVAQTLHDGAVQPGRVVPVLPDRGREHPRPVLVSREGNGPAVRVVGGQPLLGRGLGGRLLDRRCRLLVAPEESHGE